MSVLISTATGRAFQDYSGRVFGRLTVLSFAGKDKINNNVWNCQCVCGNQKIVSTAALNGNHARSCGCLQIEARNTNQKTHGMRHYQEYENWCRMKARCLNENHGNYRYYGGRGIKVCDRWVNSFENFYEDMGPRPSPKHTIDRFPNKDGNYEPGNCRWATMKEQNSNRRSNVRLSFNGENLTVAEWAKRLGINYATLRTRLYAGESVEAALTRPISVNRRRTALKDCP